MTRYLFAVLLFTLVVSTGCNLIYKQNVQQGNAHVQDDLDQITLGMTKKQVAFLLGTPAVHDPFHQDRWDYISLLSRRGNEPVRRLVTLIFDNDLLVATDGIGDSKGGDIRALADTRSAAAETADIQQASTSELATDSGVLNWTLQLGAFNNPGEAQDLVEKASQNGYESQTLEQVVPGLGTRYQVRSGLFSTYDEARIALRSMEEALDIAGITVPVEVGDGDSP